MTDKERLCPQDPHTPSFLAMIKGRGEKPLAILTKALPMNNTNNRDLLIFLRENLDGFGLSDHLLQQLLTQPECVTDLEGSDLQALQLRLTEFLSA